MAIAPSPTSEMPLRHIVLATLSLAAKKGRERVPLSSFYDVFADLSDRFMDVFPGLSFNRTATYAYSKQLDSAFQSLVGMGVDIPNPNFQDVEVKSNVADRFLVRLKEAYGEAAIEYLDQVAEELDKRVEHYRANKAAVE
jgi:hypothetical protein